MFGSLFRYDTRSRAKTNLMIFLKPTIVRSTNEGREITSERYDYLRGEQLERRAGRALVLEGPDRRPSCRRRARCPAHRRQRRLASPSATPADGAPSARIPYAFSRTHGVLAWRTEGDAVVVLMRPDATVEGIAELRARAASAAASRAPVEAERFAAELSRVYNQAGAALAHERRPRDDEADLARLMQDLPPTEDLLDGSAQAPVIRMINALLLQALRERASDLHFEPYEARAVVRFRVDGMLRDVVEPPRALHGRSCRGSRSWPSLDIAEKRLPQDGRIALKLGDRQVDVRVSTLPTGAGRARRAAPARQGSGAARPRRRSA